MIGLALKVFLPERKFTTPPEHPGFLIIIVPVIYLFSLYVLWKFMRKTLETAFETIVIFILFIITYTIAAGLGSYSETNEWWLHQLHKL
jgi:hypothetical protein